MEFRGYINDNIYGSIPVTKTEFDLINTNAFQRLRNIKQLGLTNLVFPSADHTRFSHSLGVMYIVGRMAETLQNIGVLKTDDVKKLRIAGLLHDIGHYPLSHLGEKVYMYQTPKRKPKKPIAEDNNILLKMCGKPTNENAHHENLGKYVIQNRTEIRQLLERDKIDPLEIAQIIRAEHVNLIYGQLIHSGLDADRLDYLLRDSQQTGSKYGLVDLDYLLRNLAIGKYEDKQFVGIDKRAIHSVEHFLMARYFSYSQVTWHRTVRGFETVAGALFLQMKENGLIYKDIEAIKEIVDTNEWLDFADNYFYNSLTKFCEKNKSDMCKVLISCIQNRRRVKLVHEVREFRTKKDDQGLKYRALYNIIHNRLDDIKAILKKYQIDDSFIFHQELDLKIDNISGVNLIDEIGDENLKGTIMIIEGDVAYPIGYDSSSIVKPLKENKLYSMRFYIVDTHPELDVDGSNNFFKPVIQEIKELYDQEFLSLQKIAEGKTAH